ncbi:J domain-containing protein [Natronobiforma cellulositropha]|uniref:J domain-containing protein n=1 Tax=Natronobiforma cellulositropha TaxID=1679076 RepID=UPI0021D5BD4D|nr:DnaJ domain-containing protein [Natronobiforma cellulositropha]
MTEDFDFYDLLEVSSEASQDDIKQAFREQVRIYHPDLNDDERARAQFTALKKAYDILGDPVERRAYDRLGHEDYVAKRTKGLPSPDAWKKRPTKTKRKRVVGEDDATGTTETAAGSTGTKTAGTGQTSTSSSRSRRTRRNATSSTATGSATGTATGTAGSGTTTGSSATGAGSGTTTGRRRRSARGASSESDNALVRWWRRQNVAWPLLWLSTAIYLGGLSHFGLENRNALESLLASLTAAGDVGTMWATLTESRHGVETAAGFVAGVDLIDPPLAPLEWYGALAGVVCVSVLALLVARVRWRADTWGPVSIDETIVLALALAVTTTLVGGPFLAGVVLMPLLFGVVVHRTHALPGWSPSYLFVLAVSVPALALALAAVGYASLPSDLLAYVLVPVAGALGLPIRTTIRKRFGR